jgi:hypothetical protein
MTGISVDWQIACTKPAGGDVSCLQPVQKAASLFTLREPVLFTDVNMPQAPQDGAPIKCFEVDAGF